MLKCVIISLIKISGESTMKRKVLVLFPFMEKYADDIKKRNEIITLRRQINLIVSRVSDTLQSLMYREVNALDDLLGIDCYPEISLCISDINDDDFTSGVRVCLSKYKNYDFFDEINFTRNDLVQKDVSHFVELEVVDGSNKLNWEISEYKDINGGKIFDSKLKSSIDNLYSVLLSIMTDIYAYYIVGLYNSYEFRANFSRLKIEYIYTRNNPDKIRNTYGIKKDKIRNLDYLPISLIYHPNEKQLHLKDTITCYYDIIQEYILVKNVIRFEQNNLVAIAESFPDIDSNTKENILSSFDFINKKDITLSEYSYIGIHFTDNSSSTIKQKINMINNENNKIVYNKDFIFFFCKDQITDNLPFFPHFKWFTLEENI